MTISEQAEEVLESLWSITEEKRAMRYEATPEIIKELFDAGAIDNAAEKNLKLTNKGFELAKDAVRRHRLAERLLTDVIQVKSNLIHDAACQFEHHLHKGIDENICTLLGHPKFCPHGSKIPPGKCCAENSKEFASAIASLATLKPGQGGHVAYLHTTDTKRSQMLISMGVVPGSQIRLLAGYPSLLFQLGEAQFAVDSEIAKNIFVRINSN